MHTTTHTRRTQVVVRARAVHQGVCSLAVVHGWQCVHHMGDTDGLTKTSTHTNTASVPHHKTHANMRVPLESKGVMESIVTRAPGTKVDQPPAVCVYRRVVTWEKWCSGAMRRHGWNGAGASRQHQKKGLGERQSAPAWHCHKFTRCRHDHD